MFTLNCKGNLLTIERPLIMGILNVTPDSFYEGSRMSGEKELLQRAAGMLEEGANILDIGGQSTRPGAGRIGEEEELKRVMDAVIALHREFPEAIISIDTYYGRVAREAVAAGAAMVNDISAGAFDASLIPTVVELQVPYVLMHMRGTPENMQQHTQYEDLLREILDFFIQKTGELQKAGVQDIIIDPGFGFAKTSEQNFQLLRSLHLFKMLQRPILLGISRKATIYRTLGITAEHALNGTTVLNTIGLMNGAGILRVHDVREAGEAVRLVESLKGV